MEPQRAIKPRRRSPTRRMRTLFRNVYLSEVPIRSCSLAAGQLIADGMSPFWLGRYLAYDRNHHGT